ncbi:unnamed protein product [Darwinula stevensoni]|uniref:Uncharacterized protein n=1 Tax=Darwinula stevensoni TaxID=69355 RepID=A0A7R8X9F6_9CRUS|nr:unnamed protein product [Darwinula stevensoni]CAG0884319.1 unnamed protein product [Darwinula stevensoni]
MLARPRHLSCIALACFSLALKAMPSSSSEFDDEGEEDDDGEEFVQPDPGDLVRMSQGRCTAGDVQRMARLVSAKLGFVPTDSANNTVATPFTMLVLLHRAHTIIAQALGVPESVWRLDVKKLSLEMELLCCDGRLSSSRPSVLALALLRCTVEESLRKGSGPSQGILALSPLLQLQEFCKASKEELLEVYGKVREVVESYESDGPSQSRLRQRLVWRLSPRTLKLLRPTQQLLPQRLLPPIQESPSQHDE